MDKEEIYKKILTILEKKINVNEYKIQPSVLDGGANKINAIEKLVNSVDNSIDIKTMASQSFLRISKHSQK